MRISDWSSDVCSSDLAYAQKKDRKGVAREIAAIRHIRETTDFQPMIEQLVPAPDLLRLAETVAEARLAYARGRYQAAAGLSRQAVAIEDTIRYMEPPFWYYPVRQSQSVERPGGKECGRTC